MEQRRRRPPWEREKQLADLDPDLDRVFCFYIYDYIVWCWTECFNWGAGFQC